MPVNEKAIEEFNKKLIEDSFSSTFFNDSLKKLTEIGSATPDNPAQISIDSDAYIEGTTTDIPSMDVEKISSPLKIVKQSFEEQALKNASDKQLETADDQAMKNTFDAADMAQASIENGYPEKVQAVMQSNFMNKLDEDVKYGRLSARDAITLNDINVRTIVRQTYNNVINNKSLSVEQKLKLREQIINGRTGDASIDNLPIGIRVDALNDVEDQYEKLEKRERQMIENADWETNRYIQDQMMALSSDEEINGPANSVNREIRKKNLMAVARTPAQLK